MTNPFQSLVAAPTPPAYWPEHRRTVRVLEVEEDREPFGETPGPDKGAIYGCRRERMDAMVSALKYAVGFTSARELAQTFSVCEDTINKDVRKLRSEGHRITGVTGQGYVYEGRVA